MDLAMPTPPDTNNAPVEVLALSVVPETTTLPETALLPVTILFPETLMLAPTNMDLAMPTPPDTNNAPVEVLALSVVPETIVWALKVLAPETVCAPAKDTTSDVFAFAPTAVVTNWVVASCVVLVPAVAVGPVTTPVKEAVPVTAKLPPTNKLPPTPTPPDTNNAPVEVVVEAVAFETTVTPEKVLLPSMDSVKPPVL